MLPGLDIRLHPARRPGSAVILLIKFTKFPGDLTPALLIRPGINIRSLPIAEYPTGCQLIKPPACTPLQRALIVQALDHGDTGASAIRHNDPIADEQT